MGPQLAGGAVDVGFAGEGLAHGGGVAARHGVADQQDAGQVGIVLDEVPGVGLAGDFLALVDGQVEAAEVFLQGTFPGLLISGELGDEGLVGVVGGLVLRGFLSGGLLGVGGLSGEGGSGDEQDREDEAVRRMKRLGLLDDRRSASGRPLSAGCYASFRLGRVLHCEAVVFDELEEVEGTDDADDFFLVGRDDGGECDGCA